MKPITEREVKSLCQADDYRNGESYFKQNKVTDTWQTEDSLHALVAGSGDQPYQVSFKLDGVTLVPQCTCPAHRRRPLCKHVAATLIAWARTPERFPLREAPSAPSVEARPRRASKPKSNTRQVQMDGLGKVEALLVELATYGLLSPTEAHATRVNDLAHAAESHKLRRLARLVGRLGGMLETAVKDTQSLDEIAYAELLADAWLTLQATRRALSDPSADPTFLEDLIGKTWREGDLERRDGVRLVELAYETVTLETGFIVDTSYLLALDDSALYTEKQIVPAQLKKQPRKASYHGRLEGNIGLYPGAAPRRIKLLEVTEVPLTTDDWQQALTRAERSTMKLFQQFQAVTTNPLALPEVYALFAPAHFWVDGGEIYLVDAEKQAIVLAEGWRALNILTHQPIAAVFGRLAIIEGILRLTPLSLLTPPGTQQVRIDV